MDSNRSPELPEVATGYAIGGSGPGTKSGTVDARNAALRLLVDAWPGLSDDVVAGIMRLINPSATD